MTEKNVLLPVRLVQPSRDFLHKDDRRGGREVKFFVSESEFEPHQQNLISEISYVEDTTKEKFEKYPENPLIMKAQLRTEALAKSHRPNGIFDMDTCPVIGLNRMGELLISITERGLTKLKGRIKKPTNQTQKSNITAIEQIKIFDNNDKLLGLSLMKLKERATREGHTCLKVILFDHQDQKINEKMKNNFISWVKKQDLHVQDISNLEGLSIWRITGADEKQIKDIYEHPSTRIVSFFPTFNLVAGKSPSERAGMRGDNKYL